MNFFGEFKEYKIVNGQVIEDIDVKTTKNDKQQIITGYVNNTPIYIKKRFRSTLKRNGVSKRKSKSHKTHKPLRKRSNTYKKRYG